MRKQFTTTIDEELQIQFKKSCTKDGIKMNDILEAFMQEYIAGKYKLESKRVFTLTSKDSE